MNKCSVNIFRVNAYLEHIGAMFVPQFVHDWGPLRHNRIVTFPPAFARGCVDELLASFPRSEGHQSCFLVPDKGMLGREAGKFYVAEAHCWLILSMPLSQG